MPSLIATRGLGRSDLALVTSGLGRFSITGRIKLYIGDWVPKFVKVSTGTTWVTSKVHLWNGAAWEPTTD